MTQTDRARKVELAITDLGSEGQGIGCAGDLVVFVPGALPGDRVEALVPGWRFLEEPELARRVVEPSPSRVDPACLAAPDCGGCQLLALSYPAQLEWKTKMVREALRRVGRLDSVAGSPCLGAPLPSPTPRPTGSASNPDMFPQTAHVECVARLDRQNGGDWAG